LNCDSLEESAKKSHCSLKKKRVIDMMEETWAIALLKARLATIASAAAYFQCAIEPPGENIGMLHDIGRALKMPALPFAPNAELQDSILKANKMRRNEKSKWQEAANTSWAEWLQNCLKDGAKTAHAVAKHQELIEDDVTRDGETLDTPQQLADARTNLWTKWWRREIGCGHHLW
jgi:hypothetical protein